MLSFGCDGDGMCRANNFQLLVLHKMVLQHLGWYPYYPTLWGSNIYKSPLRFVADCTYACVMSRRYKLTCNVADRARIIRWLTL